MTQPLKIGVLGSGPAGQTLATGFLDKGHPVMIGSRDSAKLEGWLRHVGPGAQVGSFAETAEFGDVVLLSVLGSAAEDVIRLAGVENLSGKIVIDASDPLDFSSGQPGLFVGTTDSLGERIQRMVPGAYVVKGLNIVQADVMINPRLTGDEPDMFIAGRQRRGQAHGHSAAGRVRLAGDRHGRHRERPLAGSPSLAWVVYSHRTGKTHHAFKLVGK